MSYRTWLALLLLAAPTAGLAGVRIEAPGPRGAIFDPNLGGNSVVLSLPLSSNGAMFEEDAGTVAHIYWDGTALQDTKGNAWTMAGTVPQVAANVSPFVPGKAGAGPFTAGNRYESPSNADVFDFTGDFRGCATFRTTETASFPVLISSADSTITAGWVLSDGTGAGGMRFQYRDSGANLRQATAPSGQVAVGGPNVVCFGVGGGVGNVKVNLAATVTSPAGSAPLAASGTRTYLGVFVTGGAPLQGQIYEIIVENAAYTDAWATRQMQRAFGMLGTKGEAISVTRATPATYEANDSIWTAPAGVLRIESSGALMESARTNYTLNSEDLTAASYTTQGTCDVTANQGPVNWTDLELVNCTGSNVGNRGDNSATPTPSTVGPVTTCWWVAAQTGTATATVTTYAGGAILSSVSCIRSDAEVCNIVGSGTNVAYTYATIGVTPTRLCITATSATAQTLWLTSVLNGQRGTSLGPAILAGRVQKEVGAYPTSYIPTAGTAVARNADVATLTAPALPSGNWTVRVDAKPKLRTWNQAAGKINHLWSLGTGSSATNSAYVHVNGNAAYGVTYDGATAFRYASYLVSTSNSFQVSSMNAGGTVSLVGALASSNQVGAGTGLWSASPATLWLGTDQLGTLAWDGWIKSLKLCRSSVLARCK